MEPHYSPICVKQQTCSPSLQFHHVWTRPNYNTEWTEQPSSIQTQSSSIRIPCLTQFLSPCTALDHSHASIGCLIGHPHSHLDKLDLHNHLPQRRRMRKSTKV